MDWQLASLNPPMTTMLIGYYRTPEDKRDADRARSRPPRGAALLDHHRALHRRPATIWPAPELTLADIGNGILVHRWHNYPIERPELPNITAWYATLSERPGSREHILGPIA